MFIGHFGVALGAKKFAPKLSLGTLILSSQFIDLLWPTLLLLGIERVRIEPGASGITPLAFEFYPYSHSLLMVLAWGILLGFIHLLMLGNKRSAFIVGLMVVSHWFLDLLVHGPDLPLMPGDSPLLGLGLWDSLPLTLGVEFTLLLVGAAIYARSTRPRDSRGRWGLLGLIVVLALIELGNIFGEAPPSVTVISWLGQAQWLLVLWGYWVDKHRIPQSVWLNG